MPAWILTIDTWCDAAFILDVLVSFRTAYFKNIVELEVGGKQIARRYLRSWFVLDVLGAIPLERFVTSGEVQVVGMFRMARLIRFGRLIKLMEYLKFSALGGIGQLYVFILLISHWLACGCVSSCALCCYCHFRFRVNGINS